MSRPDERERATELLAQLHHEMDTDNRVLKGLADRGDDPALPHAVEHHFLASSEAVLQQLAAFGQRLGFTPSDIAAEDGRGVYSCNLVSQTPISPPRVHRESLLMRFLALAHGADYDGWGTYVEK